MRLTDLFKKQPYPGTFDDQMNKSEAALILNVSQSAKKKEIMASYKKLMVSDLNRCLTRHSPLARLRIVVLPRRARLPCSKGELRERGGWRADD